MHDSKNFPLKMASTTKFNQNFPPRKSSPTGNFPSRIEKKKRKIKINDLQFLLLFLSHYFSSIVKNKKKAFEIRF
jgi:hypothetical protein